MNSIKTLLLGVTMLSAGFASGQNWMQTSAPTNRWQAIACSADGSKLVAVAGGQFYLGPIYTSTNAGATWISNNVPALHWNSVASSADGSRLAAAVYGGGIYTSTNAGATWATNNVANSLIWQQIASSTDGSKLAAVYFNSRVFLSTNAGATWFFNTSPAADLKCLAMSADGSKLIAGNNTGLTTGSTNFGAAWVARGALSGSVNSLAASADGVRLMAVSSAAPGPRVYTSTNAGVSWTSNSLPSRSDWFYSAASADGGKLAVVGQKGVIYTSTNSGLNWFSNSAPELFWSGVASSADGNKLIAISSNGGIWVSQTAPAARLNLSKVGSQLSFAWTLPSANCVLQQSADLAVWTNVTNAPLLNLTNLQNQVVIPFFGDSGYYRLNPQ